MFKNAIVFRIAPTWKSGLANVEKGLEEARYLPCGASQEKSIGWTEPRGEANGPLVEAIGGQYVMKLMIESKAVPSSVINRKVKEQVAEIEKSTGRKPGKKEIKEMKEDTKLALLPMAFTKLGAVMIWIDPEARLLVVDASSVSKSDEVITHLVKCLEGFAVTLVATQTSPAAAMSEWLSSQEPPAEFSVDRECELKSPDETKSVVRFSRHALDTENVTQHITAGKVPTRLAMTWNSRVSFLLTDVMQIKKITFLDSVFEGSSNPEDDGFDADVAIVTGEFKKLIPDLIAALGGEMPI
jgi:recombination associated protein RdgC